MATQAYVFSLADVRNLSGNLNANLSRYDGGGFSYPQPGWVYEAARASSEHRRSASGLKAAVEAALGCGNGLTPWKHTEAERLRSKKGIRPGCRPEIALVCKSNNVPPAPGGIARVAHAKGAAQH